MLNKIINRKLREKMFHVKHQGEDMKKNKVIAVFLSTLLMISSTACASTQVNSQNTNKKTAVQTIPKANNNLSEKQVLEKIKQSVEKVSSVTAKYDIKVSEIDSNNKEKSQVAKIDILSKIIYSGKDKNNFPQVQQMYDESTSEMKGKTETSKSYVNLKTNKAYFDSDGKGLKEYKGTQLKTETESNYSKVVEMLLFTKTAAHLVSNENGHLTMTENKDTYDFSFKGKNGDLFYALDGLFGIGIDTQHLEKIDIDLTYKISKKDFSLVEVIHKAVQDSDNKKYSSVGKFTITSINDIKQIKEAEGLK